MKLVNLDEETMDSDTIKNSNFEQVVKIMNNILEKESNKKLTIKRFRKILHDLSEKSESNKKIPISRKILTSTKSDRKERNLSDDKGIDWITF